MSRDVKISIAIPVKNGINTLERLIQGIQIQTLFKQIEVVVIDSGSTDGSVEYLKQFNFVNVYSIAPETFNHGATRNLAVSYCKGTYILMTVQDAWTQDAQLIERMIAHFKDNEVMGVCGQQSVPHIKGTNPHQWFRPQSKPNIRSVYFENKEDFLNLTPKEKKALCSWDDVIAMYRKTALEKQPFQHLIFGEDMLWAKMAIENGFKLVYDTGARINHYHFEFPNYTYKRTLISGLFRYKCFRYYDVNSPKLKDYLLLIFRNIKWKLHIKWIRHNILIYKNIYKAKKVLEKHIRNNTLENLENELSFSIPIGKQLTANNERD